MFTKGLTVAALAASASANVTVNEYLEDDYPYGWVEGGAQLDDTQELIFGFLDDDTYA